MHTLRTLLIAVAVAAPVAAQSGTLLNESFEFSTSGVFPPSGWSTQDSGSAEVWMDASGAFLIGTTLTFDAAAHEYTSIGVQAESYLLTPVLDLASSAAPTLVFDQEIGFANYMLHHPSGFANGVATVEVSTDGGQTWSAPIYTFLGLNDGFFPAELVDLSAYAGSSNVTLGFHYSGEFAHEWAIDNVVVDDGGSAGPSIAVSAGAPGGQMTFDFAGFSAGGNIALVYGPAGSYTVPGGACAGATLGLLPMNFPPVSGLILLSADASGQAQLSRGIPAGAAGLLVQAADVATCGLTGTIVL